MKYNIYISFFIIRDDQSNQVVLVLKQVRQVEKME